MAIFGASTVKKSLVIDGHVGDKLIAGPARKQRRRASRCEGIKPVLVDRNARREHWSALMVD